MYVNTHMHIRIVNFKSTIKIGNEGSLTVAEKINK